MIERPPLWYAFFIVVAALIFFGPRYLSNEVPAFDFIYGYSIAAEGGEGSGRESTSFEGGRIIEGGTGTSSVVYKDDGKVKVFLYRMQDKASIPVNPDDVIQYKLHIGTISPDGFHFVKAEPSLFGAYNGRRYAVVKGSRTIYVSMVLPSDSGVEPKFFGWVPK